MLPRGRASVARLDALPGWARPSEPLQGNQFPPWYGSTSGPNPQPGPHPPTQPMGGRVGTYDAFSGADSTAPKMSPFPRRVAPVVEGQVSNGAGPALGNNPPAEAQRPLGYGQGARRSPAADTTGGSNASRLAAPAREDPLPHGREAFRRFGIIGFNDQLQVRDRHAYWDAGTQRTGLDMIAAHGLPNTYNDPLVNRARPDLNTVNISINPQIGSDNTAFQDDLTRPYTWLGQQDGTVSPVYGGVPGLYIPYGTRGGVPMAVVDPTNGEGGLEQVWAGPPHGLHSDTIPDGKQLLDRYKATPQMRPVRIDRPDNSRIAGQSFSQTVKRQGETTGGPAPQRRSGAWFRVSGRGWHGEANK